GASPTAAERARAAALLPDDESAPRWSVAVMELGALICRASGPRCADCPIEQQCRWRRSGQPHDHCEKRRQAWAGTDRQARGRLLAVLRAAPGPVAPPDLERAWTDPAQRLRALESLVADGLVDRSPDGSVALPGA
ncbi:MAG: A/G-specific adenine glycosylase, partial [Actinomycetota bacterium]|nr:A/G-specific adenine glycosylase [Actinomycetota bacterium]